MYVLNKYIATTELHNNNNREMRGGAQQGLTVLKIITMILITVTL